MYIFKYSTALHQFCTSKYVEKVEEFSLTQNVIVCFRRPVFFKKFIYLFIFKLKLFWIHEMFMTVRIHILE